MKTTDWYTRTLLTLLVALLGYVAVELRTLNTYQAALTNSIQPAGARQPGDFRPAVVAWRPMASLPPKAEPLEVRIVGFKYNGAIVDFNDKYSATSGLPVRTVK